MLKMNKNIRDRTPEDCTKHERCLKNHKLTSPRKVNVKYILKNTNVLFVGLIQHKKNHAQAL